jgi:hypothetical protein
MSMRASRIWFCGTLTATMGSVFLATTPVAGMAGADDHAALKPRKHASGFFVTGQGRVTTGTAPTAFVRDFRGGEHLVTTKRDPAAAGNQGHVLYLTRQPGAKRWTTRVLPGLRPLNGIQLEAHEATLRSALFVALHQCNGVFVTETTLRQTQLSAPTLVQAADGCAKPSPVRIASAPPISMATYVDLKTIGVIRPDPALANSPTLFIGHPGGPYSPESVATGDPVRAVDPLPNTNGFVASQVTIDNATGRLVAVGEGMSGGARAIYVTTQPYNYRAPAYWKAPTKIASLGSPTRDYAIEGVAAWNGKVWVGLRKPPAAGTSPRHTLFIARNGNHGKWYDAMPLPHTTGHDTALRLLINPTTEALHVAFTRINPNAPTKLSGIMVESLSHGKWHTPRFVTHGSHDYAQVISLAPFTGHARAVIGFTR